MPSAWTPDESVLIERHANIALQNNGGGIDHSSTTSSEIIRDNKFPKTGKNQINISLGVRPHRR
jgi:hypothetical protein